METTTEVPAHTNKKPTHISIIMDGNGRWAHKKGLQRIQGHRQGVETIKSLVDALLNEGIAYTTLYAFSTENWLRPKEEVQGLMQLLKVFLNKEIKSLKSKGIRLKTIGDISAFSEDIQSLLKASTEETKECKNMTLILALNYGAREEMTQAIKSYAQNLRDSKEELEDLNWEKISNYLYTKNIPDPDLMIRTSGEIRISNFLLMQSAYTEFYFTQVPWPEFTPTELKKALNWYSDRDRRFGKTDQQIKDEAL